MLEKSLVVGEYHIDTSQNSLIHGSRKVYLGPLRTSLLHFLCKNVNKVVTRDDLAQHVWGRLVTDHTINQHISQLRKSIGTLSLHGLNISTIPKRGYIARMEGVGISADNQVSPFAQGESTVNAISNMKVLVVEAQADDRIELIGQLESLDVAYVEGVATTIEAERSVALQDFDLVIIDSLIAENAGIKLIKRIRTGQTSASADICILSSHFDVQRELLGLNSLLDVQGLLLKPFEVSRLKQMLMVASKSNVLLKPQAAYEIIPTDVLNVLVQGKAVNE
ncbi:winged helix-turn-helix domain-containing protein [Psychromonas antarctica]|jgi:DNA-binding response OmpR family regulator|uniref:winged helix-turn-helix domain-containing protein n=1 Tax=Psychromonas antarctica TaxID=67573 RepID=UPI001EE83635|nr:winged helix-turn-helix domain-containing protein [Psychromonas antarctica]MCG6200413.1 winged helix-turn-helix domain-containing protein [Psychromonas antarctica]